MPQLPKYDWRGTIIPAAAAFVKSHDTRVTLRQVHYHLVAQGVGGYQNTKGDYQLLSQNLVKVREAGEFPDLWDPSRAIYSARSWSSPEDCLRQAAEDYHVDRAAGQPFMAWIVVEKVALREQLWAGLGHYGFPVLALSGWASVTVRQQVRRWIEGDGRPAVLIYAGDFDPAGTLIDRQFAERVGTFAEFVRVGLNLEQLPGLPVNPYPEEKMAAPLIARFRREHGPALRELGLPDLVQYEVDALDPARLVQLFRDEIERRLDHAAYDAAIAREFDERGLLLTLAESL